MNNRTVLLALLMLTLCVATVEADVKGKVSGAKEFEKHCATCHPDGANIINKNKPLDRESLKRNGITDWQGIVAVMRQPGPGMTRHDKQIIPDREARAIAEYVLKTFNSH
ncbi:MAG: cytochrome C [Geobacteraceae bacterium GWB2_52_12]|nr:MAG: cytochrome C [Geobacteraceae bacterium GWB2_52_12]